MSRVRLFDRLAGVLQGLLLGGGKTYSIESVLDENYKIVQKFAGTSFIQAGHTNNFF